MLVDLAVEMVWQRLVLTETCEQRHPVVQFESFLFDAQVTVESRDDLDERRHHK